MNLVNWLNNESKKISKFYKRNSHNLLIGTAAVGSVTALFMTAKAAPVANTKLNEIESTLPDDMPKYKIIFEKAKAVAPIYGPAIAIEVGSLVCMFCSNKIANDRIAAIATAYEFSEQALKEYQDKVIETIGQKKETAIRDEIAKDHIKDDKVTDDSIWVSTGCLFKDDISKRYFRLDNKDDVWHALSRFKDLLFANDFMTYNEWMYELGVEPIDPDVGDRLGFNVTRGMNIYLSYQEAPNGEPCAVICYNTPPSYDYQIVNAY